METDQEKMKRIVLLLVMCLLFLSACSRPKKEDFRPPKQQAPALVQEDYDALLEAIKSETNEKEAVNFDSPNDREYSLLKAKPKVTNKWMMYPVLHINQQKLQFGVTHYDDILSEFGNPIEEYVYGSTLHVIYPDMEFQFYNLENYKINSILIGVNITAVNSINEFQNWKLKDILTDKTVPFEQKDSVLVYNVDDFYAEISYKDDVITSVMIRDKAVQREASQVLNPETQEASNNGE